MILRPFCAAIIPVYLAFVLPACSPRPPDVWVLRGKQVIVISPANEKSVSPVEVRKDTSYLESLLRLHQLTDISMMDSSIAVDLRYSDTSNFMGMNLYDGLRHAYAQCDLAIALCNARYHLRSHDSTLSLMVLDAARPLHIQQMMWDSVSMNTALKRKYLSPPSVTSLHNYGCAVDVTLCDLRSGQAVDMGSAFDLFDSISQPRFEALFEASGRLSPAHLHNRRLLRHVMKSAGLRDIQSEWWHFSLCTQAEAAQRYPLIR